MICLRYGACADGDQTLNGTTFAARTLTDVWAGYNSPSEKVKQSRLVDGGQWYNHWDWLASETFKNDAYTTEVRLLFTRSVIRDMKKIRRPMPKIRQKMADREMADRKMAGRKMADRKMADRKIKTCQTLFLSSCQPFFCQPFFCQPFFCSVFFFPSQHVQSNWLYL